MKTALLLRDDVGSGGSAVRYRRETSDETPASETPSTRPSRNGVLCTPDAHTSSVCRRDRSSRPRSPGARTTRPRTVRSMAPQYRQHTRCSGIGGKIVVAPMVVCTERAATLEARSTTRVEVRAWYCVEVSARNYARGSQPWCATEGSPILPTRGPLTPLRKEIRLCCPRRLSKATLRNITALTA
jgi:hypothetical protein